MFQGFKVSRFQGFKVSRFQGFKVSRCQGFKVPRFQGHLKLGLQSLMHLNFVYYLAVGSIFTNIFMRLFLNLRWKV